MPDPIPFRPDLMQQPGRTPPVGLANLAPALQPEDGDQVVTANITPDGGVDVIVTDQAQTEEAAASDSNFDENLAERDEINGALGNIAFELIDGIEADDRSRSSYVQNYNAGLDLLGVQIVPNRQSIGSETLSSVTHPVLLDACLRFRALARGEMLPATGPCKVINDGAQTTERDVIADDLQTDVNYYLTVTAREYYPDTDRGLIYVAFGGDIFKKVYYDPVRERPVSEAVYLPDLIVSQNATDLDNAERVTHRIEMTKTQVKRLVEAGAYRDTTLDEPTVNPPAIDRKEKEIQGIAPVPERPEDYQRVIYECYTELDLARYGLREPGAPEGLPLPYRITMDKDSKAVLEIRRNWKQGDQRFRKRQRFVKWPFMPGMGFYDWGYLHILGQYARALTALLRIMIDAGMLSNFPGGVKLKGSRANTNQIRPAPGEWVDIDGGTASRIQDVLMPMPYKDVSATMMALYSSLEDAATKLAGTVDLESGEGRTNVPVGTIMAMVEQQTQNMTAVHKGLHAAQQQELILLRELFLEDPESLWRDNPEPTHQWKAEELQDLSFIPASDPNVPAQMHRIMRANALVMLSQNNPLYDQMEVQRRVLESMSFPNIDKLLIQPQPPAPAPPDPSVELGMATVQAQFADISRRAEADKANAAIAALKAQTDAKAAMLKQQAQTHKDMLDFQLRLKDLEGRLSDSEADRKSREMIAAMQAQTNLILKGIETLGQQTSPDPVYDQKAGP